MRSTANGTTPSRLPRGGNRQLILTRLLIMEIGAQLAIDHSRFNRHRARLRVQRDHLIHWLEGDESMGTVGDAVEAMARAEHLQRIVLLDELPNLFDRRETMQVVRTVAVAA